MINLKFFLKTCLVLLMLVGCASNIKDVSRNIDDIQGQSIVVGRIEGFNDVFNNFSLYEENTRVSDNLLYGFYSGQREVLRSQGYFFKTVRPGTYILRFINFNSSPAYNNILRFDVPEGKLINLGTIKIVIDNSSVRGTVSTATYHFERVNDDSALYQLENQYPDVYRMYKEKLINK